MHSVFLCALLQQVKQPKTFWCRGRWERDLKLEAANKSLRIGLLPHLAQSVMNSGRCSTGLLNKVEQFNWNHRLKSHFYQMSAWCVVNPVFCEDSIWENSTVSERVQQVKPPVTETALLCSQCLCCGHCQHTTLPVTVHRVLKAKWVSWLPLALQCQDFATLETTCLSLVSLKPKSIEVRFKEKSKLAYKLIKIYLAVEVPLCLWYSSYHSLPELMSVASKADFTGSLTVMYRPLW